MRAVLGGAQPGDPLPFSESNPQILSPTEAATSLRSPGPLRLAIPTAVFVGAVFGLTAARYSFPLSYAGLYTLIGRLIAQHSYDLPLHVPYYGPGGMPLAYPPLAMYAMAFAFHTLHIAPDTYLRFAPVLFTAAAAFPLALLYYEISESRIRAAFATFLALTTPNLLFYQAFADGSVRSFAYLWTILGLYLTYRALHRDEWLATAFAGLCFGLTVLSHPENSLFFVVSLAVFTGFHAHPRSLLRAFAILACGMAVAAPWWLTIAARFGFHVFVSAFGTHGGSGVLLIVAGHALHGGAVGILVAPLLILGFFLYTFLPLDPFFVVGSALAFYGFVLSVVARRWLVPAWFAASAIFVTDGQRFWATIAALLAAEMAVLLGDVALRVTRGRAFPPGVVRVAPLLLVAAVSAAGTISWAAAQRPAITRSDLAVAGWLHRHTPSGSHYLLANTSVPTAEWFPYLAHRTPTVSPWGAEWTGQFAHQNNLLLREAGCLDRQSLPCIDSVLGSSAPAYLIVRAGTPYRRLIGALRTTAGWTLRAGPDGGQVWEHTPNR